MDIVYIVREGEQNELLRYSLRSVAANMRHGRVWIAGYKPSWVRGVGYIPTKQKSIKWQNSTQNLRAACEHPEVSDEFLAFHDDMFVMRSMDSDDVPVYHRGLLADVIDQHLKPKGPPSKYVKGMIDMQRMLDDLGIANPLSYEMHLPMRHHKTQMVAAMDLAARLRSPVVRANHSRTFYGNYYGLGGAPRPDVKVRTAEEGWPEDIDFLSAHLPSWNSSFGSWIREQFPRPCRFEDIYDEQRDGPSSAASSEVGMPPTHASKAKWVSYAVASGMDADEAAQMTKKQLITQLSEGI